MADIFRKVYSPLSDHQKEQMEKIKVQAEEVYDTMTQNDSGHGRTHELMEEAKKHLEISIMLAVKAITE